MPIKISFFINGNFASPILPTYFGFNIENYENIYKNGR